MDLDVHEKLLNSLICGWPMTTFAHSAVYDFNKYFQGLPYGLFEFEDLYPV